MPDIFGLMPDDGDNLYTAVVKDGLENRILIFNQEVTDDIIESYAMHIIRWNREDKDLPVEKRKKILLIMNSPGGDVFVGNSLINVIEASKTPIVGIAMGLVASMAYYIYIGCHTRIAFKDAVFLMHDGSICIANSSNKAKDTMRFFDDLDERTKQYVLSHTKMSEDFYIDHYDAEYYFFPSEGKELGVADMIIGEDITLDEIF